MIVESRPIPENGVLTEAVGSIEPSSNIPPLGLSSGFESAKRTRGRAEERCFPTLDFPAAFGCRMISAARHPCSLISYTDHRYFDLLDWFERTSAGNKN